MEVQVLQVKVMMAEMVKIMLAEEMAEAEAVLVLLVLTDLDQAVMAELEFHLQ